jgi:hypothetical protein
MGDLNFCAYSQKKKSYLLHFSFKFNQVKFFALFMNWLIHKKIFTSLIINLGLNCMRFIKCSSNTLLLTCFWLLQKVSGTLDHYFITAYTIHNFLWSTNSLSCDIPRSKARRTGLRHTWRT